MAGAVEADDGAVRGEQRDDRVPVEPGEAEPGGEHADGPVAVDGHVVGDAPDPVSYTHLTLPTICSV